MKGKFMERENELSRLKNLENEMAQGEARLNMMRAENDRVSSILKTRQEEIDNWKKKYNELDAITTRYSLLERDKKVLEEKYANQLKEGEELKFAIGRLETENG
jgi:chromosome segregation ATPase